jgi:hypothetical protein
MQQSMISPNELEVKYISKDRENDIRRTKEAEAKIKTEEKQKPKPTKERILRKVSLTGVKSLTPGEKKIWDLMNKPGVFRMISEFEDETVEEPKAWESYK